MSLGNISRPLLPILAAFVMQACHSGGSSSSNVGPVIPPVGLEIIAGTNPAPGAGSVPVDATVSVQFSMAMDPTTFNAASLAVFQGGNQIAGSVTADSFSATFTAAKGFASDVPMRAVLFQGVKTAAGQTFSKEYSWTFSTQDIVPIQVVSHSPFAGQGSVPLQTTIAVQFSEALAPGSVIPANFQVAGPSGPIAGTLTLTSATQVQFVPSVAFTEYKDYTVTISGITDSVGNSIKPPYSWTFKSIDLGPPVLVSTNPPAKNPMSVDVPLDVVISAKFSEPMDPFSVAPNSMQLVDELGNAISGAAASDPLDPTSITFTPNAPLKDGRVFTATLSGAVSDLAGNPLGGNFIWSFKTVSLQHGVFELVENDDSGNAITPFVSIHPVTGEGLAVWRQQLGSTNPNYAIYGSYFDPAKLVWSAPTRFESSFINDASEPSVAWNLTTGDAIAVWVQQINTDTVERVHAIPFYGGGANFWDTGFVQTLSSFTATASNPQIAYDPSIGGWQLVWQENDPAAAAQRSVVSCEIDGFLNVSPTQILDSASVTSLIYYSDLRLAMDSASGAGYAVWAEQDAGGGVYNLYARARTSAGWASAPALLETELNTGNNTNNLGSPAVTVDPFTKDGLIIWRQKLGNSTNAKAFRAFFQRLRFNPSGSVYSYPGCSNTTQPCMIQLDKDSTNGVATPGIAVDASGNALAVWAQSVPASSSTMPGDGLVSVYSVSFAPGSSVPGAIQFAENQTTVACSSPAVVTSNVAQGKFSLVFVEASNASWSSMRLNSYAVGPGWSSTLLTLDPAPALGVSSVSSAPSLASNGTGIDLCVWERVQGGIRSIVSNRFP